MKISQSFFSVQCEGATTGIPSYFVRLTGCNLSCGMSTKSIQKLTQHLNNNPDISGSSTLDREYGDLLKEGKASWVCDTISVWINGLDLSNEDLLNRIKEAGIFTRIMNGTVHFIWTGGEPTLPHHRKAIMNFIDWLRAPEQYSEIETNGTLVVDKKFYDCDRPYPYIRQINCSPKLSNSGMPMGRRQNPKAIQQIMNHDNYWFKFVVNYESNIWEIQKEWIKPFGIPESRIILMPGVDNLADLSETTRFVFEMSKKYGYRGISRSQVLAWDRVTGV